MDKDLADAITQAFKPVIARYVQYVRDTAQGIMLQHVEEWAHTANDVPTACNDCQQMAADLVGVSDWVQSIRDPYLVMVMSPNRDAWKDLSTDLDHFGFDLDAVIANAAAIAIQADISDELERLS